MVKKFKNSYEIIRAKIVKTKEMTKSEKFFEFELDGKKELGHEPGQFVQVSLPGIGEAPISISSSPTKKGSFDLCVRAVGKVTNALHKLNKGDLLGIRGPFGHGFKAKEFEGKDLLFVAGGLGLVPLRSLINYVIDNRRDYGNFNILLGCKKPDEFLYTNEIADWEKRADIKFSCTVDRSDPSWKGNVGLITTLIPGVNINPENTYAVVCGPPIMYIFVIKELLAKNIPDKQIIVSLERHMKCGLGKCGHCQIEEFYCCQDGPVFSYDQIKNIKGAI